MSAAKTKNRQKHDLTEAYYVVLLLAWNALTSEESSAAADLEKSMKIEVNAWVTTVFEEPRYNYLNFSCTKADLSNVALADTGEQQVKKAKAAKREIDNLFTTLFKYDSTPGVGSGLQIEDALNKVKEGVHEAKEKKKKDAKPSYVMRPYDPEKFKNPYFFAFIHLGKPAGTNVIKILNNTGIGSGPPGKKKKKNPTDVVRDNMNQDPSELSRQNRRKLDLQNAQSNSSNEDELRWVETEIIIKMQLDTKNMAQNVIIFDLHERMLLN